LIAHRTAQQLMERLAADLAQHVPQCHVQRGSGAHLNPRAVESDKAVEAVPVLFDPQWIFAQ
jgi:hypothetical protein